MMVITKITFITSLIVYGILLAAFRLGGTTCK